MPDPRIYWQAVRVIERDLPETVYITSIDDPSRCSVGGRVTLASREVAAKLIYEGWSRLATDDEVAAHVTDEEVRMCVNAEAERQKKGLSRIFVPVPLAESKTPVPEAVAEPKKRR